MSKRVSAEDLSAYLDGEARHPADIRTAIENSQSTASELAALQTLSARLKRLPEPDVHPAFAQRVMAHIAEQEHARAPRGWSIPFGYAAVAALLLVVTGLFGNLTGDRTTDPSAVAMVPAIPTQETSLDEAALLAELERRVAGDVSMQRFVTARFEVAPTPEDLYTERLVAALASPEQVASVGRTLAYGADYPSALRTLDSSETMALKELLAESVREAREG